MNNLKLQYNSHSVINKILAILIFASLFSCSTIKNVPEDEYLLNKYKIKSDNNEVKKDDLENYIRQKPNKKILGVRFHLYLYNLAKQDKDKGISKWLKTIGEKPVILDDFLVSKSTEQVEKYLNNKGYFNANIQDSVVYKRKKAKVFFTVNTEEPFRIGKLAYDMPDSAVAEIVYSDSPNTLVEPGDLFDVDNLADERRRLETLLKNNGFYNFSREHVTFQADSSNQTKLVDLTLTIQKYIRVVDHDSTEVIKHPTYKINNIYVMAEYDPRAAIAMSDLFYQNLDTIEDQGIYFIHQKEKRLKHKIFAQSNFINQGDVYQLENVQKTYQHLNGLKLFKLVEVQFEEVESLYDTIANTGYLNCIVKLSRFKLQSYNIEVQGTNSSGNIGVGGSVLYQNKSMFGGAEIVDFRINGSIETIDETNISRINRTLELGGEAGITIPKFLLPIFRTYEFSKKYSPKTRISLGYNYQDRPDYTRTIANMTFGYEWDGNRFTKHIVNPIELNAVELPFAKQSFLDDIDSTYLEYSYKDHFVSVSSYSFIFNNQNIRKNRDFYFFRLNSELSGNILTGINELLNSPTVDGSYEVFGIPYSQYFKIDGDFRFYQIANPSTNLVYRIFAGVGVPYGNSVALPFEKQYFSGGANSLRAWNVRDLGPGSYNGPSASDFPNQTGDIKLEANIEYRFKLFWLLEGAMFLDAGNVWTMIPDIREGAHFRRDEFYKEIAIGTGAGLRFNFSFFIFRLDMGLKLRDPSLPVDNRWIVGNRNLTSQDVTWNIAIGYPF